jgi:ribosomal-protein-alanine N-acetyltransferase
MYATPFDNLCERSDRWKRSDPPRSDFPSRTVADVADLSAQGYQLRPLSLEDAPAMAAAYARNQGHLAPWDPPRPPEFWTEEGQRGRIAAELEATAEGRLAAWAVHHGREVVGRVALNNIVQGAFRSASMGYWVDAAHTGRGVATWAGGLACAEALRLGLHRVEAGTLVHNTASQGVLRRLGFTQFGTATRYLFIAGEWRDHHLYQRILHDDPL